MSIRWINYPLAFFLVVNVIIYLTLHPKHIAPSPRWAAKRTKSRHKGNRLHGRQTIALEFPRIDIKTSKRSRVELKRNLYPTMYLEENDFMRGYFWVHDPWTDRRMKTFRWRQIRNYIGRAVLLAYTLERYVPRDRSTVLTTARNHSFGDIVICNRSCLRGILSRSPDEFRVNVWS